MCICNFFRGDNKEQGVLVAYKLAIGNILVFFI